jgi:hypothetical protein
MGLFKKDAGNPTQEGWASGPGDAKELTDEELKREVLKRKDLVKQLQQDENKPVDDENPAQTGWAVNDPSQAPIDKLPYAANVVGRVFVPPGAEAIVGSRVVLRDRANQKNYMGHVIDAVGDKMAVQWEDGRTDLDEPMDAYEFVRTE